MSAARLRSPRGGFTVIELLVASVLMAVMVGVVLSLTTTILSGWNRSTDRLARTLQAEAALDRMAADLAGLVWEGAAARPLTLTLEGNPGDRLEEQMSLRFHSSSAAAAQASDHSNEVRGIALYLDTDRGGSPFIHDHVPGLFRGVEAPASVWEERLEPWPSVEDLGLGAGRREHQESSFLLPYCVSLRFELWGVGRAANGGAELVLLNDYAAAGGPLASEQAEITVPWEPRPGDTHYELAYIDVSLRVLSPEAAAALARESGGGGEIADFDRAPWLEANSAVFTRRVELRRR